MPDDIISGTNSATDQVMYSGLSFYRVLPGRQDRSPAQQTPRGEKNQEKKREGFG